MPANRVDSQSSIAELVNNVHRETFIFDGLMTSVIDGGFVNDLRSTGIDAVHYTVANMSLVEGELLQDDLARACRKIAGWLRRLEELKEHIGLATSLTEMWELHAQGRIAIFFGMQNASPIEEDVDLLDVFHRLGVRFVQLTYNSRNFLGSGSGESTDAGLSELGVRAVERMNVLGMVIDLSHCGYRTTLEAIACSIDPVAFTHANVRSLAMTPRNKSDEQLRALAAKGGVAGVKHMLGDTVSKPADQTSFVDIVDHLEYLVDLIGIDHVSIGTDFRGTSIPSPTKDAELAATRRRWANAYLGKRAAPSGFRKITDLANITGELLKRGYSSGDIGKIYGGNLTRLLEQVLH